MMRPYTVRVAVNSGTTGVAPHNVDTLVETLTLFFFCCQFGPASIYLYMHIIGWLYDVH